MRFQRLRQKLRGELARNTGWMLLSQAGHTVVQAIYFVLMARSLGVSEYGLFIAVAALGSILAPFALFGMATLAVRTAARDRAALPAAWGNGLLVTTLFGGTLVLLMALFGQLVLPGRATLSLVLSIGIAELVFTNMHHIHSQMFLAVSNGRRAAQLPVLLVGARMLLALAFFATGQPGSATTWGLLYLIATVAATAVGFGLTARAFGRPRIELDRLRGELATGFSYAIGLSSTTVYADIDKTMLARMTTTAAAGAYAAAYRIVGIVMAPIFSLLYSSFANFFQHGVGGMRATARYALRLLPLTVGYGVLAGGALYVAAPIVPTIFGDGFAESVTTIRWLAVLPLLKGVQCLGGDVLTGADRQPMRSALQLAVAALNVLLNLWLIPAYSFRGAIYATLASEVVLLLAIWGAIAFYLRRERSGGVGDHTSAEPLEPEIAAQVQLEVAEDPLGAG